MNCRLLSDHDFTQLFGAFKSAFSNNVVVLQPSEEEFRQRIGSKVHVDNSISGGFFDGAEMVGFILHTSNVYQGIPTAYNGGTGVLPGFRNQKAAEQLYAFLIPKIQAKFLARILLEVVESNENAIKLYEKIGFTFKRRFYCYKQTGRFSIQDPLQVVEGNIADVDFNFMDFDSSFLDSEEHLNLGREKVLLAYKNHSLAGYLIFQPHLGRISQLAVSRLFRHQRVGESLIHAAQTFTTKVLTIMNIPEDEVGFDAFLKKCNFENQVNQFEMELII